MEEESTRQSRLFVILAIALVGLLVLGLLGIGGVFVIRQNVQEQAARAMPTPTLMIRLPNPSPTFTPVSAKATSTVMPTPVNTPVVGANTDVAAGEKASVGGAADANQSGKGLPLPTPTKTPVAGAETAANAQKPNAVPDTGVGALEAVMLAAGLVLVVFVARRMRMSA
jgi:hypothetical protein